MFGAQFSVFVPRPTRLCSTAYTGAVLAPLRFVWNATRGFRLRPWRSPYVRWRIETYSGLHAETMTGRDVVRFTWRERRQLLRFLRWTATMDGRAGRRTDD